MTGLLGPNGQPISSTVFAKTAKKPLIGEIAVPWTGSNKTFIPMPGNNLLQFDTSKLKLSDFRLMRDHYQINSSLSILTFMLHQVEYKIECDSAKVKKHVEWNLEQIWTRLIRAMSQAFWAGFSPNALQWQNDVDGKRKVITKVKDLYPEECRVHWKKIDGVAAKGENGQKTITPKIYVYDGIDQRGFPTIPVENSFWFPLLMENGDFYGRKLLKAAFQPWYFSLLNHVYTNRYFERFGEPVPIARAPFDDVKTINGQDVQGNVLMSTLVGLVRSGAAVVLPNDKIQNGTDNSSDYEYSIEYLKSDMRGADFERYLARLDEEITMALFTPISAMKSTSEGYNSGVSQMQTYMHLLRAIVGDMKEYIDKYILAPMAIQNFGVNTKLPEIKFHKIGGMNQETLKAILVSLISGGKVKPDIDDLGRELGLTLTEIKEVLEPVNPANSLDPSKPGPEGGEKKDKRTSRPERTGTGKGADKPAPAKLERARNIAASMAQRVTEQHGSHKHSGAFSLGHMRQVEELLGSEAAAQDFYQQADAWIGALATVEDNLVQFQSAVSVGLCDQFERAIGAAD